MSYKILLIGCGNIGSRYLQGLKKSKLKLDIYIIEKSQNAINVALDRIKEIESKNDQKFYFSNKINKNIKNYNLCIVSTSSFKRYNIVSEIPLKINIDNWIFEKVLCQNIKDLRRIRELIEIRKAKAWVNTSNRTQSWLKKIKLNSIEKNNIDGIVRGNNWGMMCNTIHILDLFTWWTSEKLILVDAEKLNNNWFKSKRVGFMEVNGNINAKFSGGSVLKIFCSEGKEIKNSIEYQFGDWKINPSKGSAYNRKNKLQVHGGIKPHSQIISKIIDNIIVKNKCSLPSLEESIHQHKIFLEAILPKWQKYINKKTLNVPIT